MNLRSEKQKFIYNSTNIYTMIRFLVNRAIKICNNRQLLFLECEKITKMLQQNGYPIKISRNVIRKP